MQRSTEAPDATADGGPGDPSPLTFFLLVFVLSIPFWLAGAMSERQLLPGLPPSSLMVLAPLLAALLLTYRARRAAGVTALLRRSFDGWRLRARVWYAPMLLLMPGVMLLEYAALRATGSPIPPPQIAALPALALSLAFFASALAEELGWMGYAADPLQAHTNALQAGLILGAVWAIWHIIPLAQVGRSAAWIAWWSLGTVAQRVIIAWLYNNSGRSLFGAAAYHATINLTWQLFPVSGSFYDPRTTSLIVAGAAAVVTVIWGPRTLARR